MMVSDDGRKLAFGKQELAVLTGMMAKEERPSLAALWFHGGQAKAWATDGFRAVMVEREIKPAGGDASGRAVAIPAATAHHVAKTAGARDVVVIDIGGADVVIDVREPNDRHLEIEAFDQIDGRTRSKHKVTCKRHEGGHRSIDFAFPAYQGRGSKGATVAINPALLAPVITLGKVTDDMVWINIDKSREPVLFTARADAWTVWRIVVMPMRDGGVGHPESKPAEPAAAKPAEPAAAKPAKPRGKRRRGKPAATDPAGELAKPAGLEPAPVAARGRGKLRAVS